MVVSPPNFRGGPKNFRPKKLGGGPEQKNKFNGELNLRGDLEFLGGVINPNDVMVHSVHWGINPLQKQPSP